MKLPFLSSLSKKVRGKDRPPFEKYYILIFILFLAYMASDLAVLYSRQYLIPTTVPPKKMMAPSQFQTRSYQFSDVVAKNMFNSDGKIPPSLGEMEGGGGDSDGTPRKSELPLDLIGTIVHANPSRSVATIVVRGQNKIEPYMVGQKIESMAEVKQILREKVIFRNSNTGNLEYIEIPVDQKILLSTEKPFSAAAAPKAEEKTEFNLKKADIEKELENLPNLLQQALAVPESGADGQVRGYKLVQIQPGSMYEKLGLRIGDVIMNVNGEEVTNPNKAMQMYQDLRSSNNIKITVERNGSPVNLNYNLQ